MFFRQIVREDIGCAAYLVASTNTGEAAVIDPRIDMVDEIIGMLAAEGLVLRYVIETHNHADHVAGHHQLVENTGATIVVHQDAGVEFPHHAVVGGDELELGEVRLRVIHTPGHRPEHIAIAAIDTSRGDDPWLVLTGDSLFIGDVARPDLAIDGREGASDLFHTLQERLLTLPDGTLVFPGHVAGSLCGRVTSRMTGTSIGYEQAFNPALAIDSEPDFVEYMNDSLPQRPPNMARIIDINRSATPLPVANPMALTAEMVARLIDEQAQVLDVRSPGDFSNGHIPNAITVHFNAGQFQNRVGLVIAPGTHLVIVANSDDEARQAIDALAVIGVVEIDGYLAGGMNRWIQAGYEYETTESVTVQDLNGQCQTRSGFRVIDVREPGEWESGHIDGAVNIPFHQIRARAATLEPDQPTAVVCGSGVRSMIAASILQAEGINNVVNVEGGMTAWEAAALKTTQEDAPAANDN